MKLPMQARPIMRSVSSGRISEALKSGVTATACNWENCAWALGVCAASIALNPAAGGVCLLSVGAGSCRECIGFDLGPPERRWREGTVL